MAATIISTVFCVVTLSSLEMDSRLEELITSILKLSSACHLLGLLFDPEDGGSMFLQNVALSLNSVVLRVQKIVLKLLVISLCSANNNINMKI
jgi:hypothetical protein